MRTWAKFFLLLNAWSPLFLIVLIKNYPPGSGAGCVLITLLSLLTILSYVVLFLVIALNKSMQGIPVKISKISSKNTGALIYIVVYLIPFVNFDLSRWNDAVSLALFLIVAAIIYVRADLKYANPVLNVLGYSIYEAESGRTAFTLISRRKIRNGELIEVVELAEEIYLESSKRSVGCFRQKAFCA